jgi:hypothetical protein
MTASLIKKAFLPLDTATPIPLMTDTLPYHEEIKYSRCEQVYTMGLPSAQDRLFIWRIKAQARLTRATTAVTNFSPCRSLFPRWHNSRSTRESPVCSSRLVRVRFDGAALVPG